MQPALLGFLFPAATKRQTRLQKFYQAFSTPQCTHRAPHTALAPGSLSPCRAGPPPNITNNQTGIPPAADILSCLIKLTFPWNCPTHICQSARALVSAPTHTHPIPPSLLPAKVKASGITQDFHLSPAATCSLTSSCGPLPLSELPAATFPPQDRQQQHSTPTPRNWPSGIADSRSICAARCYSTRPPAVVNVKRGTPISSHHPRPPGE